MSEPFSFYWHDYETWGRVPRRDRPAQFAGVRTDAALNEVEPPLVQYCQPPTDALPEPEAVLLTGILPQQAQERGLPEHRFAAEIEARLARPGTVGVGYNSIRFDDEVTRHLFWRNLIDPYAREWQNGNGRWDLLDVLRCAYALRPDGIEWPRHDDGRPSFKLEHFTRVNGIAHVGAHDALADVRATIALARRLRAAQLPLWDFCLKLRRKDAVWAEIGANRPFLHVSGRYGPERGCIAVVWPLAPHPTNKNELIVWDLAEDPTQLVDLDVATLRERLYTRADALPEGVTRLPIKTIKVNRSPVVIGKLKTLSPAMAERWGLDLAAALAHAQDAAAISTRVADRWRDVFTRPAPDTAPDVDEDLYGGFLGNDDRNRLARLRALPPQALASARLGFDDARLAELVFRWRARNFPETLSPDERAQWEEHRAAMLHGNGDGRLTVAAFFEKIDALAESADERGQQILAALYDWAEGIAPEA
jgi:exodeoxyribonuclease-1